MIVYLFMFLNVFFGIAIIVGLFLIFSAFCCKMIKSKNNKIINAFRVNMNDNDYHEMMLESINKNDALLKRIKSMR